MSVKNFIFGVEDEAINFIFIVIKWFIVKERIQEKQLTLNKFKPNLFMRIIAEKQELSMHKFSKQIIEMVQF